MAIQSPSFSHRIAFYPCCASDVELPRRLLSDYVDEIVYCDIRKLGGVMRAATCVIRPAVRFVHCDARECVKQMQRIDVLFYRRDSYGEGGSAVYVLGKPFLGEVLKRMPDKGGLIITDGSNSGSGMFRRMTRPNGYASKTWRCHLGPAVTQPFIQHYNLHIIEVSRIAQQEARPYGGPAAGSPSGQP